MRTNVLLLAALGTIAAADTIRLRDGTQFEGIPLREEGDHQVFQIQVTPTIRDERRVLKSEIREIVAERKDLAAFSEIETLVPTPNLLDTAAYDDRINRVRAFLEKYPDSGKNEKAREMLAILEKERATVAAGGIKFEGDLIEASERTARAYPLDARIAANRVLRLAEANQTIEALREWEKFRKEFAGSQAYLDTLPYVLAVMKKQLAAVNRTLGTLKRRTTERQEDLAALPINDRSRTERLIREEAAAFERRRAAEGEAGLVWKSLSPWHKESLSDAQRKLEQEIRRLEGLDRSRLPDNDRLWTNAWIAVTRGDDRSAAREAIREFDRGNVPERYVAMLEERLPSGTD